MSKLPEKMIILLYGPDSYRRNVKLKELLESYREKYTEKDISFFDFEDNPEDWLKVRDILSQPSMFVDSKVVVVKEGTAVRESCWIKYVKSQLKSKGKTFLFFSESRKPSAKFSFLLKPPVKFQEFKELEGRQLQLFINNQTSKSGIELAPAAWQFFFDFVSSFPESRSALVVSELGKLKLANLRSPISLEDLKTVIGQPIQKDFFRAAREFLRASRIDRRLLFLEEILQGSESAEHAFNLLAFQAKGEWLEKFARYDVLKKSGRIDSLEALLDLALRNDFS